MQFRPELQSLDDKVDYSGIRPLASYITGILKRVLRRNYWLNEERTLYTTDRKGKPDFNICEVWDLARLPEHGQCRDWRLHPRRILNVDTVTIDQTALTLRLPD